MSDDVKYPRTHAELDAIASAHGVAWSSDNLTVEAKQGELADRGITPREAQGVERFEVKRRFNGVELNFGHLDEPIVLEQGKPFETSDPTVIAALLDHPAVKRVADPDDSDGDGESGE